MNNSLHQALNKQVANFAVFFTKLHHFHWFITGKTFFTLHEKFEALYDEVNNLYDAYAERLITIGGTPSSTLKSYLEITSLGETTTLDAESMVDEVISDLKILSFESREITKLAQKDNDEQTADLAISTVSSFEKHIWMLNAFNK